MEILGMGRGPDLFGLGTIASVAAELSATPDSGTIFANPVSQLIINCKTLDRLWPDDHVLATDLQ
jgi:hypothetical protein